MADDTDTDDWPGYTPEEMNLPTELVERIRLVCSLLHLPVAERHGMPGVALGREEVWKPGEPADHVTVSWNVSDKLFDIAETQGSDGRAEHLCGAIDALERGLVDALRRGGLRVERDTGTQDWKVLGIAARWTDPSTPAHECGWYAVFTRRAYALTIGDQGLGQSGCRLRGGQRVQGVGMGVLWKLEPATEAKHRLYKQYLDAWWPIFLQTSARTGYSRPRVTLLDAFAGPGRYLGGEEGSPVFILRKLLNHTAVDRMNLRRQRVRLIFIEKERPRYEHLRAELVRCFGPLEDLPVHVEVHHGEAGQDSGELLTKLDAWGHPVLGIFDSWGNINVPLSLMRRIAHNPSSEVITTFGPNWFSREQGRQMASEEFNPEVLDMVFGGREFWSPADAELRPDERWRVWLSTYRDALRRAGFRSQLQFRLVPRTGQPLYLVFGTGHPKGLEAMKEAMWKVDVSDGMSFKDPRTRGGVLPGQSTLFAGADVVDPELLELVHQRLSQGVATVEDIGQWLLTETSRWLPKHALAAVQELRNDGVVMVLSSGKLTRKSRVSLN